MKIPLKFLADENISKSLVSALRKKGHDVKDIKEDRIILTHDKHFGNLLNYPLKSHCGVILIRYRNQSPDYVISRLIPLLNILKNKINNSLTIITEDLVKIEKPTFENI